MEASNDKIKTRDSACYWKDMWQKLNNMRHLWQLCDITIFSDDNSMFMAHSPVLAASSEQFHAHFIGISSSVIEEKSANNVYVKGLASDVLQVTLDFIYGILPSTVADFEKLQQGTEKLGVVGAMSFCSRLKPLGIKNGRLEQYGQFSPRADDNHASLQSYPPQMSSNQTRFASKHSQLSSNITEYIAEPLQISPSMTTANSDMSLSMATQCPFVSETKFNSALHKSSKVEQTNSVDDSPQVQNSCESEECEESVVNILDTEDANGIPSDIHHGMLTLDDIQSKECPHLQKLVKNSGLSIIDRDENHLNADDVMEGTSFDAANGIMAQELDSSFNVYDKKANSPCEEHKVTLSDNKQVKKDIMYTEQESNVTDTDMEETNTQSKDDIIDVEMCSNADSPRDYISSLIHSPVDPALDGEVESEQCNSHPSSENISSPVQLSNSRSYKHIATPLPLTKRIRTKYEEEIQNQIQITSIASSTYSETALFSKQTFGDIAANGISTQDSASTINECPSTSIHDQSFSSSLPITNYSPSDIQSGIRGSGRGYQVLLTSKMSSLSTVHSYAPELVQRLVSPSILPQNISKNICSAPITSALKPVLCDSKFNAVRFDTSSTDLKEDNAELSMLQLLTSDVSTASNLPLPNGIAQTFNNSQSSRQISDISNRNDSASFTDVIDSIRSVALSNDKATKNDITATQSGLLKDDDDDDGDDDDDDCDDHIELKEGDISDNDKHDEGVCSGMSDSVTVDNESIIKALKSGKQQRYK